MSQKIRKMVTVQEVMDEYLEGSYRKVKAFLLQNLHYKKIGNTYYFAREEVERKLLSDKRAVYKADY